MAGSSGEFRTRFAIKTIQDNGKLVFRSKVVFGVTSQRLCSCLGVSRLQAGVLGGHRRRSPSPGVPCQSNLHKQRRTKLVTQVHEYLAPFRLSQHYLRHCICERGGQRLEHTPDPEECHSQIVVLRELESQSHFQLGVVVGGIHWGSECTLRDMDVQQCDQSDRTAPREYALSSVTIGFVVPHVGEARRDGEKDGLGYWPVASPSEKVAVNLGHKISGPYKAVDCKACSE